MKVSLLVLITFLFISCGQTTEEEVADVIEEANLLLSSRRCDEALAILGTVPTQSFNKKYLDSLSTAYACKGNYSSTTLFASEFPNLNTTSGGFFGSLAAFSTSSDMTTSTDTDFTNLQTAIDTLLYAGNLSSASASSRSQNFTATEATDINLQAFYMILVNMGRWFRYYGNTDTAGSKGGGSEPNTCIATYTDGNAIAAISAGVSGSCTNGANLGHVDTTNTTLCQGIVLYNNFIDTISNLTFTGTDADTLNTIKTVFTVICAAAAAIPATGFSADMCNVRDLSTCLTQTDEDIERFSASIFEVGLQ